MFDFNLTIGIQFVNFVVTLVVLDFLLIRPIRAIIKKRRDLASGMLSDAETFTTNAAEKLDNYETALAKAREAASALRDERKAEGLAKEAALLESAQRDAQDFLRSSREETREAIAVTMAAMEKQVPELADMVVSRLLGKSKRSTTA